VCTHVFNGPGTETRSFNGLLYEYTTGLTVLTVGVPAVSSTDT